MVYFTVSVVPKTKCAVEHPGPTASAGVWERAGDDEEPARHLCAVPQDVWAHLQVLLLQRYGCSVLFLDWRWRATGCSHFLIGLQPVHAPDPVVVIAHPVFVKTVLNTNSSHFDKERDPVIIAVIGHGLLLANGEAWKRQRKIMVRRPRCA